MAQTKQVLPLRCLYAESASTDPYFNLGLEKYLFDRVAPGERIFYLWQNRRTVVCGRNQNVFRECSLAGLEAVGGHAARRLSGGGAVFHDLGNLNFSFLSGAEDSDTARQLSVLLRAVAAFGVPAELTGRNDVTAAGRKFSGSAFYRADGVSCHHGTVMIDVDGALLEQVLNVSREKLESKGVDSVRARVVNLSALCPAITPASMKAALRAAFLAEYGGLDFAGTLTADPEGRLRFAGGPWADAAAPEAARAALAENRARFADPAWIFGRRFDFTNVLSRRFPWGGVALKFRVEEGAVTGAEIESDSLLPEFITALEQALPGRPYRWEALAAAVAETAARCGGQAAGPAEDLTALLRDSI